LNKTIVQSTMFYSFQKEKVWKVKGTLCCLDKDSKSIPLSTILMIIHIREKVNERYRGRGMRATMWRKRRKKY